MEAWKRSPMFLDVFFGNYPSWVGFLMGSQKEHHPREGPIPCSPSFPRTPNRLDLAFSRGTRRTMSARPRGDPGLSHWRNHHTPRKERLQVDSRPEPPHSPQKKEDSRWFSCEIAFKPEQGTSKKKTSPCLVFAAGQWSAHLRATTDLGEGALALGTGVAPRGWFEGKPEQTHRVSLWCMLLRC